MKTFLEVMLPEKQQKPVQAGVRHSLSQRVAMLSLFLYRTSVVHVNLFVSSQHRGPTGWSLHQWLASEAGQSSVTKPLICEVCANSG